MFDLTGKVAVVTGGSSGLGVQFAHALGRQGATVIVIARRTHLLEQVAADIAAEAIEAKAPAPVAEPAHVADAPVSNAATQKSSDYDGIWAVAAAANAQAKKRKVYRARLLRREV